MNTMSKSSWWHVLRLSMLLIKAAKEVEAKITISLEPLPSTAEFVKDEFRHYDSYLIDNGDVREEFKHPLTIKSSTLKNTPCVSYSDSPKVNEEESAECAGMVDLDLSSDDVIEFSFQAPLGKTLYMKPHEGTLELEFQGVAKCPGESEGSHYQEIPGSKLKATVLGSETSELFLNASSSFLKLGKCDGCSECEVFTKLAFIGPIDGLLLSKLTWEATYDRSNMIAGVQTYKYSSQGYNSICAENISIVDALPGATSPRKLQPLCSGPNDLHSDCPDENDVTATPTISRFPTIAPSVSEVPSVRPSVSPSTSFPSVVPSSSPTVSPSLSTSPTVKLSESPSLTPQPSSSPSPTTTTVPTITSVPTITASPTVTAQPSITALPSITAQPSKSASPTITVQPSNSMSPSRSESPTVSPSPTSTASPSETPVPSLSSKPSQSSSPTLVPSISCASDSDGLFGIRNGTGTQVKFTFELETDLGSTFETIRPPLETAFNNGILAELFDECRSTADNIFRINRRLDDVNETDGNENGIVGISSRPIDAILSDVNCAETSEVTNCNTVAGALTIFLSEGATPAVEIKKTLDALKDGMKDDLFVSAHPSIKDIRYVDLGTKSISDNEEEEDPPVDTIGDTGDDKKVGLIAGLVVGCVALCLALLLFFVWRRRRNEDEDDEDEDEDEDDVDFEALEDGDSIPNGIPAVIGNPFGEYESRTEAETEALSSIWETATKELEVVKEEGGDMPDAISTSDSESGLEISSASSNDDNSDKDDSSRNEESSADGVSLSSSDGFSADDASAEDGNAEDGSSLSDSLDDDSSEDSSVASSDAEDELQRIVSLSQAR